MNELGNHTDTAPPLCRDTSAPPAHSTRVTSSDPSLPRDSTTTTTCAPADLAPVSGRYIWLQVLASFGAFMAFITPVGFSLALKLSQIAPGHAEYLGYITGAGAAVAVVTAPLFGQWSDRTRSRWGRRRPFIVVGSLLGVPALATMALAPSVLVLGVGWVLTQLTWGTAFGNLQNSQADRLPEDQRGKVAGLTGFAQQIAPVVGVGLASVLIGGHRPLMTTNLLVFLVPGVLGLLFVLAFALFVHEPDSRSLDLGEALSIRDIFRRMVFKPSEHPDFAWNWIGRFLFYVGLTFNTTFTTFYFAQTLHMTLDKVAGIIAMLSLAGILAVSVGAIGGGFLSDRAGRRKPFVLASGVVFGLGACVLAVAGSMPLLVVGSILTSIGLGLFSAVDQALALDVLPNRDTEAGRYMAIMGLSVSIPQTLAPLIASQIILVGAHGSVKNYSLLYCLAAALTALGGMAVLRIRKVR